MNDQATAVPATPATPAPIVAAAAMPAAPTPPPATKAPREQLVTTSAIALMDTAQFEHMQRIAQLMAKMELLPIHLRARPWFYPKKKSDNLAPAEEKKWREDLGPEEFAKAWAVADARTVANCILVVDQALRWGMNPFATMGETYEVGGKLANQGKLVAAVVNSRANLAKRLEYRFSGEPKSDHRTVTVVGIFEGETEERTVDLSVGEAKTDNQMWRKDPDQKLIYSGVVKWARRHCPEVVLGIITDDDIERVALEEPRKAVSQLDTFANGGPVAALPSASPAIEVAGGVVADGAAVEKSGDKPASPVAAAALPTAAPKGTQATIA